MTTEEQILKIEELNQKIAQEPNNAELYLDLAQIYFEQKDYSKCLELESKAIEIDQNNFKCHFYRGNTYFFIKEYEKAIRDYTNAIRLRADEKNVYYSRAFCYAMSLQCEESVKDLNQYCKLKNIDINIDANINLPMDNQLYGLSKAFYKIICKVNKDSYNANYELVELLCNRTLELNPLFYKSHTLIGDLCLYSRENSIDSYTKSINIKPTIDPLWTRSLLNDEVYDYEAAREDRRLIFALLSKNEECNIPLNVFFYNFAQDLYWQKEYIKAIEFFEKSKYSNYYIHIGQAYRMLENYEKALEYYRMYRSDEKHSGIRCILSLYAAFCYLKTNCLEKANIALSYFKDKYNSDIHSMFEEEYNGTIIDFDEIYILFYKNKFFNEFVEISNLILLNSSKTERYLSPNLIETYKQNNKIYWDNKDLYQNPAHANKLFFLNIFVLFTENKIDELDDYFKSLIVDDLVDMIIYNSCFLTFTIDPNSIIVNYLISRSEISDDNKARLVYTYLTELIRTIDDNQIQDEQKKLLTILTSTIECESDKYILESLIKVWNGENLHRMRNAVNSINIPSVLPRQKYEYSNTEILLSRICDDSKYKTLIKDLILAYNNYIRLKENLRYEKDKQQARLEERNLIIQKQAHDIKNMLSSVSAPISIVQNKINSPLLKQALKANQLMSRAIDAISQSFGVNPDDFYYDAKNNENGITLNDLIWSALDNAISNIMANNNRMKQFTNNYFASANWKQANSDYANLEEHDKHEIISEFKAFISKYFFELEINFDNSANLKIGTAKSSDFNLFSLFNELILNAVKYTSYTEFEKRKVVISLANNDNEIVFSVANSSMKTIDTKTAGTGNLILENFTKLINCKVETSYNEADAMYSSKLILKNFWRTKMSKILYIDDELDGNKITKLFGKYPTETEENELSNALQSDIPSILANNIYIQAEYDFVKVLKLLENDFEKYSFFIVDRDLKGTSEFPVYDVGAAEKMRLAGRKIEPKREGDYIFIVLLEKYCKYSNPAILFDTFFFLTANDDKKLSYNELFMLKPENIKGKDHESEIDLTNQIINKFEDLVIKSEHREVFDVFNKGYLDNSHELSLISLLKNQNLKNSTEISGQISILRNLFQEVLERTIYLLIDICKVDSSMSSEAKKEKRIQDINDLEKLIPNNYGKSKDFTGMGDYKRYIIETLKGEAKGNIDIMSILDFLNGTSSKFPFKEITFQRFTHSHYLFLSLYDELDRFWKVCSENQHGGTSSPRPNKYKPSRYTLPILTNIMLDFLLWYGDFMDKYSKPTPSTP